MTDGPNPPAGPEPGHPITPDHAHHEVRDWLNDAYAAGRAAAEGEVERLREWKANEQANIIHMAAQLVGAGFKGDGDSIMSALDEALADRSALSARVEELEQLMAETLEAGIPIMGDSSMNDVWCYFCEAEAGMAAQIEHSSGCLWTRLLRALAPKEASNGE
jgi:hypothetical protein